MSRQSDTDNHSDQMNPNNDAYWVARGHNKRPADWKERIKKNQSAAGSTGKKDSGKR